MTQQQQCLCESVYNLHHYFTDVTVSITVSISIIQQVKYALSVVFYSAMQVVAVYVVIIKTTAAEYARAILCTCRHSV